MKTEISNFITFSKAYCSDIRDLITSPEIGSISTSKRHFLDLLIKIQINVQASVPLVEMMASDLKFKLPLSLVLRSVSSDILTIMYLATFYDENSEDQISLENEITLLDRDFICQYLNILEEEMIFKEDFRGALLPDEDLSQDYLDEIKKRKEEFSHLIEVKPNGKVNPKRAQIIRQSSKNDILGDEKENDPRTISENHKYKRIKNYPLKNISEKRHVFFLYKYYSQFYHSCPANYRLLHTDLDIDCAYLVHLQYYIIFASAWVTVILFGEENVVTSRFIKLYDYLKLDRG